MTRWVLGAAAAWGVWLIVRPGKAFASTPGALTPGPVIASNPRLRSVDIRVDPTPAAGDLVSEKPWETSSRARPYLAAFREAEAQYGLPEGLLSRVAYQESRYRASAESSKGAVGLMQFLPATARELGVNPYDPFSSIDGAGRYLAQLRSQLGGSLRSALYAYNWGIGNVQRRGVDEAPVETQDYVTAISADVHV